MEKRARRKGKLKMLKIFSNAIIDPFRTRQIQTPEHNDLTKLILSQILKVLYVRSKEVSNSISGNTYTGGHSGEIYTYGFLRG